MFLEFPCGTDSESRTKRRGCGDWVDVARVGRWWIAPACITPRSS